MPALAETAQSFCRTLKRDTSIDIVKVEKPLRSKGLTVESVIAGEAGHNTRMLIIFTQEAPLEKCEVIIRDGKVAGIKL